MSFVTGDRLLTTRGEVAVEDLAVGDEVLTASGEAQPIVWIGSRRLAQPGRAQQPVRVRAGAFAEATPTCDVLLSPGHLVVVKVVDEVFIPIGELVNGATVARERTAEAAYWQVELERHEVVLAEGLKTGTSHGERDWADGGEGAADPEPTAELIAGYARPFVAKGAVIEALRMRLIDRAEALGWTRGEEMDVHLLVDGERCEADVDGDLARFVFPASAQSVVIASRSFVPAWRIGRRDQRELGVALSSLHVFDGLRVDRAIPLDHPLLAEGFHKFEDVDGRSWRWTSGRGVLPAGLWDGCRGLVILRLGFDRNGRWSWTPPPEIGADSDAGAATLRAAG